MTDRQSTSYDTTRREPSGSASSIMPPSLEDQLSVDPIPRPSDNNDSRDNHHSSHETSEDSPLLPSLLSGRVAHEGESGRRGFHPKSFVSVSWTSSNIVSQYVNLLWPFVPAAIIVRYLLPEHHLWIFTLSYLAMIPSANLLGFAGQEFAKKMPKVAGILIETTFGSIVEIILFIVLIIQHKNQDPSDVGEGEGNGDEGNLIPIIQAAILGSILTNLLLCLGLCFFCGGIKNQTQKFHAVVSETGSGLLLVAGFALLIPSALYSALKGETVSKVTKGVIILHEKFTPEVLEADILRISQITSIVLMVAFGCYLWYNARSQHSIFDEVIEMDEHRDADREADASRMRYTGTET